LINFLDIFIVKLHSKYNGVIIRDQKDVS